MQQHTLTSARAPLLNLDSCLKNTGNVRGIIVNSHIDDVTGQPHRARRQAWVEGTKKVSWQWTEVDDDDDDDDKNNNSVSKFHLADDALPNCSVLRDSKSMSEASDDGDETMTLKEQSSVEDDHFTAVRNTTSYSGSSAAHFKILSPTWLPFSEDPEHRLECVRCQYYHSRFVQEKILNYASLSAKRNSLKTFSVIHNSADAEVPSVDCSIAKLKQTHDLHSAMKSVDKKAKSQHVSKDYFSSAASRDKKVQFFVGDQNVQVLNSHGGIIDEKDEVYDLESWVDSASVTPVDKMALSEARYEKVSPVMTTDSVGDVSTSSYHGLSQKPLSGVNGNNNNNNYNNNNNNNKHLQRESETTPVNTESLPSTKVSKTPSPTSNLGYNGDIKDTMGNTFGYPKNDTDRGVTQQCRTSVTPERLSVSSVLPERSRIHGNGIHESDFVGVVASVEHDQVKPSTLASRTMHAPDSTETRRRNFSSSSLPVNLMTSTIEEVDDGDYTRAPPAGYSSQRSYSYSGTGSPSPKVPIRALRREARVPSLNSPPRTRRPGPLVGLDRSLSDHTTRVGHLKDLDIVGESFDSRYPWQKDVAIQCYLQNDCPCHPYLHRAMSGPAMYTYFRSLSLSSNSPASSPPHTTRRPALHTYGRSSSHSDLIQQHSAYGSAPDLPPGHMYQRHCVLSRSNSTTTPNCFDATMLAGTAYCNSSKRANFWRRPRPSSMGAVENIRYQHELTKFRELHNLRRDRKSDPQLVVSPGCRRRVAEDSGSISDLESILENPSDRPWDISRQTSITSLDYDDDYMQYAEGSENSESLGGEFSEDFRSREDVLPSPPISPRNWATFDDEDDIVDSDDSMHVLEERKSKTRKRLQRSKTALSPFESPVKGAEWMDEEPLLESGDIVPMEERGKLTSRLSMRRKLWKQNRKLKRGLTCDTILFKPPPDLVPQPRRLSSGSITSDAESEGTEPDPPVVRRGRRSAIYETKNCGDVSPTTLSPEVSPSNSCDEGEGASNIAERLRRRRSSVDLAMNIYPGDLLVQEHHKKLIKRNTIADFYAAGRQPNGVPLPPGVVPGGDTTDVTKKGRQPFSLLKLMKTKSKESLTKLDEILRRLKPSEFKDKDLAAYKSLHWSDLIASTDKQHNSQMTSIIDTERKRREAVWELFKSECVFLIDHLMVLKHCFMEPLKKVQVEGSLMFAEPQDLFGNLDELSYVSYTFCKDFIAALLKDMSITDFGRTNVLLKAFQRFSAHSRDGAVYHSYCLNYANALTYLEKLRANSEFSEFEKWCEQDSRCNRLQLTDLLVAPMQHCTKLPLLLHNVRKYTADEDERQQVAESIEKMEASLKQLEEKMKWIKNFERVQEIQRQIVWPTVTELDPRCVIPESLKSSLCKQPCERLLICPKRQLLHEGQLTLVETPKPLDIHMFLFDDILLISKVKKIPRKSKQSNSELQTLGTSDRTSYIVLRQPLALDRFTIHDISPSDAAVNGLKHCFVLVHISRFQQIIGAFTFQAACDATKNTWLLQIRDAMEAYAKAASSRNNSFKENRDPKAEEKETIPKLRDRTEMNYQNSNAPRRYLIGQNSFKNVPTKSRSMDAVFI